MNRVKNAIRLMVEGAYTNTTRILFGADRLTNTKMRDSILSGKMEYPKTVNYKTCISCGMCSRACPMDAIEMTPRLVDDPKNPGEKKEKPFPVIDQMKCVYCFQCHDICPVFTKMKKPAAIHPRGIEPLEFTAEMI
ncbi:MAG: 4Fe-4S dicluster domain-containing protein [Candidatus Altiarchaeota archaeon]